MTPKGITMAKTKGPNPIDIHVGSRMRNKGFQPVLHHRAKSPDDFLKTAGISSLATAAVTAAGVAEVDAQPAGARALGPGIPPGTADP